MKIQYLLTKQLKVQYLVKIQREIIVREQAPTWWRPPSNIATSIPGYNCQIEHVRALSEKFFKVCLGPRRFPRSSVWTPLLQWYGHPRVLGIPSLPGRRLKGKGKGSFRRERNARGARGWRESPYSLAPKTPSPFLFKRLQGRPGHPHSLVTLASPSHITLAIWVSVRVTGDTQNAGMPISLWHCLFQWSV